MKKPIVRGLAFFLSILMMIPAIMLAPTEVLASTAARVEPVGLVRNFRLGRGMSAVSEQFLPAVIQPDLSTNNTPNTFAFDFEFDGSTGQFYVIFPLAKDRVVRLDFRRRNNSELDFLFTRYSSVAAARAGAAVPNFGGYSVFSLMSPTGGYEVMNFADRPLVDQPGTDPPVQIPDPRWPSRANAQGVTFNEDPGNPNIISATLGIRQELDDDHTTIVPISGFSFKVNGNVLGDANTTFHLIWNNSTGILTFGMNSDAPSDIDTLLRAGLIYTFEFGIVPAPTPGVPFVRNPVQDIHARLYYNLMNGFDLDGSLPQNIGLVSNPFARDYNYDQASLDRLAAWTELVTDPALAYVPTYGWFGWTNWRLVPPPFALPIPPRHHMLLYSDDTPGEPENFSVNWYMNQRLQIEFDMPYAWDDAAGNFHMSIPQINDHRNGVPNLSVFTHNRFNPFQMTFQLESGRSVNMNVLVPGAGNLGGNLMIPPEHYTAHGGLIVAEEIWGEPTSPAQHIVIRRDSTNIRNDNRVQINIAGEVIQPSFMFHESFVIIHPEDVLGNHVPAVGTNIDSHYSVAEGGTYRIPRYRVYTFIGYRHPEYVGGSYEIEIIPYRDATGTVHGFYHFNRHLGIAGLRSEPPVLEEVTSLQWDTNNPPWVFDPLNPGGSPPGSTFRLATFADITNPASLFGRIFFWPAAEAGPPPIESLPLRIRPNPLHVMIGAPRDFTVIDYRLDPVVPGDLSRSWLTMRLSWRIADPTSILNQLQRVADDLGSPNSPAVTLPIYYDLNQDTGGAILTYGRMRLVVGRRQVGTDADNNPIWEIMLVDVPVEVTSNEFPNYFSVLHEPDPTNPEAGRISRLNPVNGVFETFVRVEAMTTDVEGRPEQPPDIVFFYPNVYLLNVSTSRAATTDPPLVGNDSRYILPNRVSLNDTLTLSMFPHPWVAPPQNFLLEEEVPNPEDEDFDDRNALRAILRYRFHAPYRSLRDFAEQQFVMRQGDLHVRDAQGNLVQPLQRFIPIPTFTLLLGTNEQEMLAVQEFMRQYNLNQLNLPNPWQFPISWPSTVTFPDGEIRSMPQISEIFEFSRNGYEIDADREIDMGGGVSMSINDLLRAGHVVAIIDHPAAEPSIFSPLFEIPADDLPLPGADTFYGITGLDRNQRFYGAMFTMISFHHPHGTDPNFDPGGFIPPAIPHPDTPGYNPIRFFSDVTGIVALTTDGEHIPIDPDEIPPARPIWQRPEDLGMTWDQYYEEFVRDTWARLFFRAMERREGPGYRLRYEVVRTTQPINPLFYAYAMNSTIALDQFLANRDFFPADDIHRVAFRWSEPVNPEDPEGGVQERSYDGYRWRPNPKRIPTFQRDLDFEGPETQYIFEDDELLPNNIYYFYLRAVKLRLIEVDGVIIEVPVQYSIWDAISITTLVVEGPRNLVVLRGPDLDYDPMSEAILQFEVPPESWGFNWQLEILESGSEWVLHDMGRLPHYVDVLPDQWRVIRFDRIAGGPIIGLQGNTDYVFRVRLIDPNGQPSLWSNEAFHRTDFDQGEHNLVFDTNSWIEFIRRNLWQEFDRDYWPLEFHNPTHAHDTGMQLASLLLYRHSRVGGMIDRTYDSQLYIYTDIRSSGNHRLDIVLPWHLLEEAARNNKALIIRDGELETIIPPGAFTDRLVGISEAISLINAGQGRDYYVLVSIEYTALAASPVDGNRLAERQATITAMALISNALARDLDNAILEMVTEALNGEEIFEEARGNIRSLLEQNIPLDEIARFAYGTIFQIRQRLMGYARMMYIEQSFLSLPITHFARPLLHGIRSDSPADSIHGFVAYTGNFAPVQTLHFWAGRAVGIEGPASVLFTMFNVLNELVGFVEEVHLPGNMATVIAHYSLGDFVGRTQSELQASVTLSAAMNIAARIAGAEQGADGMAWMRDRGYSIVGKSSSSAITRQEAAFVVMALYELRSGLNISTITVRNQAAAASIPGIDTNFLQSVRVAFEFGLISPEGFEPRASVSMMEFLNMLSILNMRISL